MTEIMKYARDSAREMKRELKFNRYCGWKDLGTAWIQFIIMHDFTSEEIDAARGEFRDAWTQELIREQN